MLRRRAARRPRASRGARAGPGATRSARSPCSPARRARRRSGPRASAARAPRARSSGRLRTSRRSGSSASRSGCPRVTSVRGSALSSSHVSRSGLSTSPVDGEVPGREVGVRDRARVQDRPLLGEVLAGRQPRGVVSRLDHLPLGSAPEHASYTSARWPSRPYESAATPTRLRRRSRSGRRDLSPGAGLERRRGARPGRGVRGAAPDAEGARVAPMVVLRRAPTTSCSSPSRGSASGCERRSLRSRFAAKCEIELEEHTSAVVLGGAEGSRRATTASPRSRCSTRTSSRRSATTSSSSCGSRRARRVTGVRSTTACFRPRPGSTRARSTSRRAATRARSPSRASTTAGA